MNKSIKIGISCLMMAFLYMACGCSKDLSGEQGDAPAGVVVKPKYNRTKNLRNPLTGWVMYAGRNSDANYWDTQIYVASLGKNVKISDYATCCYIRTSWSSLNPRDNEYAWKDPNSHLYKLIKGAADRGLPMAFRVVVDGRDQGANTPQFVYDAGAKYAVENDRFPDRKTPMPQDPIFQQYYTKFIEAFAAEFNDPDRTAFIDGYGLGKWGEGHSVAYSTENVNLVDGQTEQLKEEVLDWITKLYARCFTKIPLVINYHRVLGHPTSMGTPNVNSDKLVALAVNNGFCLRSDAFGMNDPGWGYTGWEKATAATWRYKVPIIMEGGYIVSSHSYWNDPAGYRKGHPEDVRKGEFDSSAEARVNMMDFRVGEETVSWFKDSFTLVQRFISEGGYRLYPDRVWLPEQAKAGESVKITHRWRNMGWGYLPNNIPQWNYKYKVAFALLNSQDQVISLTIDGACEPSKWVESTPFTYETKAEIAATIPAGEYTWAVAIVDSQKGDAPAIELAVNEPTTANGWVKLMQVKID